MDKAYLVLVEVITLGGQTQVDVDVFRAEDEVGASNCARNIFIKEGSGAVVYGETIFLVEAIATLRVRVLAAIDLSLPENKKLAEAADVFDTFLRDYETKQTDRSVGAVSESRRGNSQRTR